MAGKKPSIVGKPGMGEDSLTAGQSEAPIEWRQEMERSRLEMERNIALLTVKIDSLAETIHSAQPSQWDKGKQKNQDEVGIQSSCLGDHSRANVGEGGWKEDYRSRCIEMPVFSDGDPDDWIFKAERFFTLNTMAEQDKMQCIAVCLEGELLAWFQYEERRRPFRNWVEFRSLLVERFRSSLDGTLPEQFLQLRQTGTVREYRQRFERAVSYLSDLPEYMLEAQFVTGLRPDIRAELLVLRPKGLDQLMITAQRVEDKLSLLHSSGYGSGVKIHGPPKLGLTNQAPPLGANIPSVTENKTKGGYHTATLVSPRGTSKKQRRVGHDGDELAGLHCFRHLRDQVTNSIESINSILSAEFMCCAMRDAGDIDAVILSKAKAKAKASILMNGEEVELKFDEEEASNFRDRLLPVIIGLLRTARLPSVLRIYRDTVITDMKTAIKNAVAELLPVLVSRPLDSNFVPGERTTESDGGASLASKLKSLSSETFVQLLSAIFMIVQVHLVRASEVKKSIEWIMCNIDEKYAAGAITDAIALGAAAAETTQVNSGQDGSLFSLSLQKGAMKLPSFDGKGIDAPSPSNMSKNFRADVLRENTEAVFAACDAAHGRWAKLLGVRIQLHPKLRLREFLTIYNITQEFITASEKIGGRLGYSIRGTLQSQAKAFVDSQHESRMAKIKAVLDQETWVEVDIPDEFQAIIASLSFYEESSALDIDDSQSSTSYGEMVAINDGSHLVDGGAMNGLEQSDLVDSDKTSAAMFVKQKSIERNRSGVNTPASQSDNSNLKERGKSTSQTVIYKGVSYHMVNCGLILLKILSEYIDMNDSLPILSSEIVHRVVEILKFFNTRTCQLVLGAGAMQVSGLKSITSKHLALASQVISFIYGIIPEIRHILFLRVPDTRKSLLLSEIDRVSQDYKIHRDEIHAKLVQIMRERMLVHLRGLPQIVESWNRPGDSDAQPSQFARSLTKEVGFLQRVLSRTLHEADVQVIFRQVVIIFHSQISEAFSQLEISTPQAKDRLFRDVKHILGCIRLLPTDDHGKSGIPNWGQLDEFFVQTFDDETA